MNRKAETAALVAVAVLSGAVVPMTAFALTINGTSRSDTLYGTDSADTIYGKAGADKIYGYKGDDMLESRNGIAFNHMHGGPGADEFRCYGGYDVVEDFNEAEGDIIVGTCESTNGIEQTQ